MTPSRNAINMMIWSILGTSVFALAMGMFFAQSAAKSPAIGQAAIPASLAFGVIGMIGGNAFQVLRLQEKRLRELEKREIQ